MCGIVAIVSRNDPLRPGRLEQATQSLSHRGPDGSQASYSLSRIAGLGHARLSIIDLTTGAQPIANETGTISIVVNGEFYDFERYQRELTERGHCFKTKSDSEIALHLYEESGIDFLSELRGEFALAIWDERTETLIAARDRFGIKPLYYVESEGTLYIASEIKAFLAADVHLRWDHESVAQSLYSSLVGSRTLYEGVRQVPPGFYLISTKYGLKLTSYWDLNYVVDGVEDGRMSDDDWIEQTRQQIKEATRLRLRADVSVGCLLSGGLDSSSILGITRTLVRAPMKAFTVAFETAALDESSIAMETASSIGADFHPIRVTNADFATTFHDAVWHMESFCYNTHTAARFILSRAIRDAGIKVVLSGEGADELTAGYRFCRHSMDGTNRVLNWPPAILDLLALKHPTATQISAAKPILTSQLDALNYPKYFFDHRAGQMARKLNLLDDKFLQDYGDECPQFSFLRQLDIAGQINGREPIRQVLYLWMKSSFANYILCGERFDMAHGIELRLPFLDHKLFEFSRNIPTRLLMRKGREKWILREAMKPFITERVYNNAKHPFVGPPSALQDGSPMLGLVQDRLRSTSMAEVPFFKHNAVVKFLDSLPSLQPSERVALDPMVLLLLSFCILQERFKL